MEKKSGVLFALALAAISLFAFGGTLAAADEAGAQANATIAKAEETAKEIPVSVAGMTVFIDAETGALRPPTAEEAAALAEAMQRQFGLTAQTPESFAPVQRPDGTVAVALGLSQLDFSVATVGTDGEVEFSCVDSAHEAADHVHAKAETGEER